MSNINMDRDERDRQNPALGDDATRKMNRGDTQELPAIEDIKAPFPQKAGEAKDYPDDDRPVRELARDKRIEPQKKSGWWTKSRKRKALLAGAFCVAVLLGLVITGYSHEQQAAQQKKIYQAQQLKDKESQLKQQEADLERQKQDLEKQKKALEQRQSELADQSGDLKAAGAKIGQEGSDSTIGKIIDKVTGKTADREKRAGANQEAASRNASESDSVQKSLAETQQMLDNVDSNIKSLQGLQQEAHSLTDKAQAAYDDNKGTIDKVMNYVGVGADIVKSILFN